MCVCAWVCVGVGERDSLICRGWGEREFDI